MEGTTKRDKAQTKQKILAAVDTILLKEGIEGIGVNKIAKRAGISKQLIYRYFGDLDSLLHEYISSKDIWRSIVDNAHGSSNGTDSRNLQQVANYLLERQFDIFYHNGILRELMRWSITDKNNIAIAKMIAAREKVGIPLVQKIDKRLGLPGCQYGAVAALLLSGVYFIALRAHTHEGTFCGIDINDEFGRQEIKKALRFINDLLFEAAEKGR